MRRLLKVELKAHDYRVAEAATGREALAKLDEAAPAIVLLDLTLPDMDGLELLQRLRERSRAQVIVVSARRTDLDRIQCLRLGATDYIEKPFNPEEVVERVNAVLRRMEEVRRRRTEPPYAEPWRVAIGNLTIESDGRSVFANGQKLLLQTMERRLLDLLIANRGRIVSYDECRTHLIGADSHFNSNWVRAWGERLRQTFRLDAKLPDAVRHIGGAGFVIDVAPGTPVHVGPDPVPSESIRHHASSPLQAILLALDAVLDAQDVAQSRRQLTYLKTLRQAESTLSAIAMRLIELQAEHNE